MQLVINAEALHALSSDNPYTVLGVSRTATPAQIIKAYRKRCLIYHPDKGGTSDQFSAIQRAYALLSDKEDRAFYDDTNLLPPAQAEIAEMAGNRANEVMTEIVNQMFLTEDRGARAFSVDPVDLFTKCIAKNIQQGNEQIKVLRAVLKQSRKLRRRMSYTKGKFNASPLGNYLYERQCAIRMQLAKTLVDVRVLAYAFEHHREDYAFKPDTQVKATEVTRRWFL